MKHILIKRTFDIIVSSLLLLMLFPVIICLAILISFFLGYPIFFRQERPGLNGKPFQMIKFRTMKNTVDVTGKLLSDEERLTSFGHFLRASSLDELPELWNVLKGQMSLVGPRPLLMEYLAFYSPEQNKRHKLKPGITGLAQINGRNAITWENKFKLDILYVENQSFLLDIKILFLTIKKVLKREGITSHGNVTSEKFTGFN